MNTFVNAAVNAPLVVAEKKLEKAEKQLRQAENQIIDLQDQIANLRKALSWYAEHAAGCRIIHSDGDVHRNALQADGGKRAWITLGGKG